MRKKQGKGKSVILFWGIILILLAGICSLCFLLNAAKEEDIREAVVAIDERHPVEVDVDGDGEEEVLSIRYVNMKNEVRKTYLYCDGQLINTFLLEDGNYFNTYFYLCDLYKDVKGINLIAYDVLWNYYISNHFYVYQWRETEFVKTAAMGHGENDNIVPQKIYWSENKYVKTKVSEFIKIGPEDGEFSMLVEAPFASPFGHYFISMDYHVVGDRILSVDKDEYKLSEDDWNKVYEIEKTGTVVREDGSKYELKEGTKFKILAFRIKNKEDSLHGVACYIKIQELTNKKEYWIDGEKTPDFIEGGNINGTDLVWDEIT